MNGARKSWGLVSANGLLDCVHSLAPKMPGAGAINLIRNGQKVDARDPSVPAARRQPMQVGFEPLRQRLSVGIGWPHAVTVERPGLL